MEKTELLKSLVMDRSKKAKFSFAKNGVLNYIVDGYIFPIDMTSEEGRADVGTTTFNLEEKSITMMRYIRKAINNDTLVNLNEANVGSDTGGKQDFDGVPDGYVGFSHAIAGTLYYTKNKKDGKYSFAVNMDNDNVYGVIEKDANMEEYMNDMIKIS
jgi:hypothetical protein